MNATNNRLAQFQNQKYLNLETYRKSGVGVPTPVWFVQDGEILYVRTGAVSGKIKRIRNNRQVRVAPCDMRGSLKGEWVEAQAELIEADVARRVNGLLDKKYGLMKKLFEWFTPSREGQSATVAIRIN